MINDAIIEDADYTEAVGMVFPPPQSSGKKKKKFIERPSTLPERFTDQHIKHYFARKYKSLVQYVPGIGWHQWDGSRWCTDIPGGLYPLIDEMQKHLMDITKEIEDDDARARERKALINLESHDRQTTIGKACEQVPALITSANNMDNGKMLLNVQNGTIDLSTGSLKRHNSADLITRIVNIEYDASATCPTFEKFISWAMCGDMETVSYLQRFIGYCLTGVTSEQILNFWYGSGGNGKSTLMNVIQWLLCDYGTCADTSLIMKSDSGGTDSNRLYMLAELRGARLVTLSEVNDGQKLDEAQIKSFTGGDVITARQIYEKPFSYVPQAKLIGFGNYRPHVRGTDHGIWRRIHLVPFHAVITDADKDQHLPEKLRAELPGILAWAVRGCMQWQQVGQLKQSKLMLDAVGAYRQNEDTFQSWLAECCFMDVSRRTSAKDLIISFKEYSGWKVSEKKFSELMKSAGFTNIKSGTMFWEGISFEDSGRMGGLSQNTGGLGKSSFQKGLGKSPPSSHPPKSCDYLPDEVESIDDDEFCFDDEELPL